METQVGKMRSPEAHLFFFQPLTRGHYNPCHILLKASIIYMDTHNCHYSNDKNACNFYPPDKDLWLLEKAPQEPEQPWDSGQTRLSAMKKLGERYQKHTLLGSRVPGPQGMGPHSPMQAGCPTA